MSDEIVEISDDGSMIIPARLTGNAKPHAKYEVQRMGESFFIKPMNQRSHLKKGKKTVTAKKLTLNRVSSVNARKVNKSKDIREWIESLALKGPDLTLEQMGRDTIYD